MTTTDGGGPFHSAALTESAEAGRRWLFDHALPLWWRRGYDPVARAYHEALRQNGEQDDQPRRVRVQARQVIVYARAGRMGWRGPWKEAVEAGLDVLLNRGLAPSGAPRHTLAVDGAVLDPRPDLYDFAFIVLALAEAQMALALATDRSLIVRADQLLTWLDSAWRNPGGGYAEGEVAPTPPRRQNPHMHLFEALQSLYEAGAEPAHYQRAAALFELFHTRLFDSEAGFVPEYFDEAWRPLPNEQQTIEPGHQFEWSWLLRRWTELGGAPSEPIAERLRCFAERFGVDPRTGAVYDALAVDLRPTTRTSRLWTHTERIKANTITFAQSGNIEAALSAHAATDVLLRYFGTSMDGLWFDRMTAEGGFADEPAPASSFYHIILALFELSRAAGLLGKAKPD